jgi:hypothetical protein
MRRSSARFVASNPPRGSSDPYPDVELRRRPASHCDAPHFHSAGRKGRARCATRDDFWRKRFVEGTWHGADPVCVARREASGCDDAQQMRRAVGKFVGKSTTRRRGRSTGRRTGLCIQSRAIVLRVHASHARFDLPTSDDRGARRFCVRRVSVATRWGVHTMPPPCANGIARGSHATPDRTAALE